MMDLYEAIKAYQPYNEQEERDRAILLSDRVSEDGGTVGQYPLSKESIVPGQRDNENEHCPDIVHGIKRSASIGYINNGTMGQ